MTNENKLAHLKISLQWIALYRISNFKDYNAKERLNKEINWRYEKLKIKYK